MNFRVRHFDVANRTAAESVLEAASIAAARSKAAELGMVVLDVKPILRFPGFRKNGLDLRLFCREIRSLLLAGMTIVEALETLSSRANKHPNTEAYRIVMQKINEGRPLSVALEDSGLSFPILMVAGIRASERSGRIAEALAEYLQYEEAIREGRRKLVNAAVYPLLVVGFGVLVTLFLLGYVVPRFSRIYDDFPGKLSMATQVIMSISRQINIYISLILISLISFAATAIYFGRVTQIRSWLVRQIMRIKWLYSIAEQFQLARIHRTLALLLRGGFPLPDALELIRGLSLDAKMNQRVANAKLAISEGRGIEKSFATEQLVDEVGARLIAVGERSGSLDFSLDTIAQELQSHVDTRVERLTKMIEPILLFGVALLIGAIVVMMYLPIFDLAEGVL